MVIPGLSRVRPFSDTFATNKNRPNLVYKFRATYKLQFFSNFPGVHAPANYSRFADPYCMPPSFYRVLPEKKKESFLSVKILYSGSIQNQTGIIF